jgi:hypothetical protein
MPRSPPNVEGVEPIFRIEGWATANVDGRTRVELAIWPPVRDNPDYFAPMRCGLRRGGEVLRSYGVSPEQAVHLAFKYLQIEVDLRGITDDAGRPIVLPIPPEPPLIEP